MKSTDRQLFLRHQRRCVKCHLLGEARSGKEINADLLKLLKMHEVSVSIAYHLREPESRQEHATGDLPGN